MPSSSRSKRSSKARKGRASIVVDAANKVQVAKVSPVDDYQGLRVLESGLEAGQKVIVEGIQLVRPGQVVEPVEVPLEQFQNTEPADLRRRSALQQPGLATPGHGSPSRAGAAEPDRPSRNRGRPSQSRRRPAPDPERPSPTERPTAAPEKKAR